MGFTSWLASEIIQINQSHPPAGTRDTPTSCYFTSCLPQSLQLYSTLKCNPHEALYDMCWLPFPRLWVYTTNKVLSVLSAQYWLLFGRIPLSPMVCIWGNQKIHPGAQSPSLNRTLSLWHALVALAGPTEFISHCILYKGLYNIFSFCPCAIFYMGV